MQVVISMTQNVNQTQIKIKTKYKPPIVQILKHIKKKCSEYVSVLRNPDYVYVIELDFTGGWATVKSFYCNYLDGRIEKIKDINEWFQNEMCLLLTANYITKFEIVDKKGRKWEIEYRYLDGFVKKVGSFDAGYIIAKHSDYIYIIAAYKGY